MTGNDNHHHRQRELTAQEAARLIGADHSSIDRWASEGLIRFVQPSSGRGRRYTAEGIYQAVDMPREWEGCTEWMRAGEVAVALGASRVTVIRRAREGRLPHITLPSGQRRYPAPQIQTLAAELSQTLSTTLAEDPAALGQGVELP